MKIIKQSREITKKELYDITKSKKIGKIKDLDGQQVDLDFFVLYETPDTDGEIRTVTAIRTIEGEVYASNSKTVAESFLDMLDIFEPEEIHTIEIVPQLNKSGSRTYYFVTYIK